MPEGPEVAVLADELNKMYAGKKLLHIAYITSLMKVEFNAQLDMFHINPSFIDAIVKEVISLGKKVIFVLNDQDGRTFYLIFSLGMTGHFSTYSSVHSHIELRFQDAGSTYFNDPRRFGSVELKAILPSLGVDPLKEPLEKVFDVLEKNKKSRKNISAFLMDQQYLSGIGNYLKSEVLYDAKISPFESLSSLSEEQMHALAKSIVKILTISYECGGYTLADYKHVDGKKGCFVPRVYGREVDDKGNKVLTITQNGRTTWYVKI
jgi:endonuclease-8